MKKFLFLFLLFPILCLADTLLVYQYNDNTRIVLSRLPCDNGKKGYWRAVAQRIDGKHLHACWSREPHSKLVRLQWEAGDFTIIDAAKFKLAEVD